MRFTIIHHPKRVSTIFKHDVQVMYFHNYSYLISVYIAVSIVKFLAQWKTIINKLVYSVSLKVGYVVQFCTFQ